MKAAKKIKILIVDDHAVVLSGLSAFLMAIEDFELIGEASSGEEAIEKTATLQPDVLLMDLKMPGMGGLAAIRAIRQKQPKITMIALTSYLDDALLQGALQAGANGYLMKNVQSRELAQAIRSAIAGRMMIAPEVSKAFSDSNEYPLLPLEDLTERERDVLRFIINGLSNNEIAGKLLISASTVKYHIGNIFTKLGVESRVAAVSIAIQRQLIL